MDKKVPKALSDCLFDGKTENYRIWWSRMRDHLISNNPSRARVVEVVEQQRRPYTLERQKATLGIDGVWLHLPFISTQLWAFIGNHLTSTVHARRRAYVGGEDYNGLEL